MQNQSFSSLFPRTPLCHCTKFCSIPWLRARYRDVREDKDNCCSMVPQSVSECFAARLWCAGFWTAGRAPSSVSGSWLFLSLSRSAHARTPPHADLHTSWHTQAQKHARTSHTEHDSLPLKTQTCRLSICLMSQKERTLSARSAAKEIECKIGVQSVKRAQGIGCACIWKTKGKRFIACGMPDGHKTM